jgi:uncharacterized membrane protein YgcG
MSSRRLAIAVALVALAPAVARAQADVPPRPAGWVADEAKLLTPEERQRLEALSDDVYARHGARLAVLTLADAKGEAPKAIAVRALNSWAPGPRSVLLLVVMSPRKLYVQPGTDLAPKLGEAECSSICSGQIAPHLKAQRYAAGLTAGLEAIRDAIVAMPAEAPASGPGMSGGSTERPSMPAPRAPAARGSVEDIVGKIIGLICPLACVGGFTAFIVGIVRLVRRPPICPQCQQRTVKVSNRILAQATYASSGRGERTKLCPCGWTTAELYVIPMLVETTSYDSSSSSSFDSGSSSSSSSSDGSGGGGSDF